MNVTIEDSWKTTLSEEFKKDYFKQLSAEVKGSYLLNEPPIYPPASLVFNAFNLTPLDEVKVVILGQDPYHGIGQAHGLSFSVPDGVKIPRHYKIFIRRLRMTLVPRFPKAATWSAGPNKVYYFLMPL